MHMQPDLFVAQVLGESMNRRIPSGACCLFQANPRGTRNENVVVAEHRSIQDPELEGRYTIKVYSSSKVAAPRALARSGSDIICGSTVGTICHECPKRSFSHPHCSAKPPSRSALQ